MLVIPYEGVHTLAVVLLDCAARSNILHVWQLRHAPRVRDAVHAPEASSPEATTAAVLPQQYQQLCLTCSSCLAVNIPGTAATMRVSHPCMHGPAMTPQQSVFDPLLSCLT